MIGESIPKKIWRVLYPVLTFFAIYFIVIYIGTMILASNGHAWTLDMAMSDNFALITCITLAITLFVEYIYYRNDFVVKENELIRKPVNIILLTVFGMLLAHGLSLLISLLNLDGLLGNYSNVENEIFGASAIFVLIRVVILTPLAEELVFRGLTFNRLKNYTGFWAATILSSALFGLYHMNLAQGVYAFLYGIVICLIYDIFQNLWAPILLHFAGNLISVILQYAKLSYQVMWVYLLVMVITLGICVALFFKFFKKLKK
ncbi:MAG: CPBP family intramembrane metalloprotease [Lachnospiraceae bacterium]|nr:CPBP family intramembrane metalloprotease [Lachnospiraceae bacterium]